MAGHKGYAIAVVMDMLSGILSGSGSGTGVAGPYQAEKRSGAGQFMLALDIAKFQTVETFAARMEAMIADLKSVPLAQGYDEVFYPGEIEARNDARHRAEGLTLPEDTLSDLRRLAEETGVPLTLA